MNHPDLELLRPPISGSAVIKPDVAAILPVEGKNCFVPPGIVVDGSSSICEAAAEGISADALLGKEESAVEAVQRVSIPSATPLTNECSKVSLPSTPSARMKDILTLQSDIRNSLPAIKEEPETVSASSASGTVQGASSSAVVMQGETTMNNLDMAKTDQIIPVVSTPMLNSISTTNNSVLPAQIPVAVESTVKTPKATGAGRGSKQQAASLAVETPTSSTAGRGVGRGNSNSNNPHSRPQAPPSPAALSPAATSADAEEEVEFPAKIVEICAILTLSSRIFREACFAGTC